MKFGDPVFEPYDKNTQAMVRKLKYEQQETALLAALDEEQLSEFLNIYYGSVIYNTGQMMLRPMTPEKKRGFFSGSNRAHTQKVDFPENYFREEAFISVAQSYFADGPFALGKIHTKAVRHLNQLYDVLQMIDSRLANKKLNKLGDYGPLQAAPKGVDILRSQIKRLKDINNPSQMPKAVLDIASKLNETVGCRLHTQDQDRASETTELYMAIKQLLAPYFPDKADCVAQITIYSIA